MRTADGMAMDPTTVPHEHLARRRDLAPSFSCSHCDKNFSRQEHLTRHSAIHTKERPFSCNVCNKRFARSDTLHRHVASHNLDPATTELRSVHPRACKKCAAARVRCSRGCPCSRCINKGLSCAYPPLPKKQPEASTTSEAHGHNGNVTSTSIGTTIEVQDLPMSLDAAADVSTDTVQPQELMENTARNQQGTMAIGGPLESTPQGPNWMQIPSEPSFWDKDLPAIDNFQSGPYGDVGFQNTGYTQPLLSQVNWLSPTNEEVMDWDALLAGCPRSPRTGVDLLGPMDSPYRVEATPSSNANNSPFASSQSPAHSGSSGAIASVGSQSSAHRYYVEGGDARAPFRGMASGRRSALGRMILTDGSGRSSEPPGETFSQSEVSDFRLEDPFFSEALYNELRQSLSRGLDSDEIPTYGDIRLYAKLYYQRFHITFPFIQRRPFRGKPTDWILLLAISAVGSSYSDRLNHRDVLLNDLRTTLHREFYGLGVPHTSKEDNLDEPDLSLVQANTLNVLLMLHSDTPAVARAAVRERSNLTEACLSLDLLNVAGEPKEISRIPDPRTCVDKWSDMQSRTRTRFMIWLLDTIVDYETNTGCRMQLAAANIYLPCHEKAWDHPCVRTIQSEAAKAVTLVDALETLYMEKRLPANLSDFSILVIIHGIYRRSKEVIQRGHTQLDSWTPSAQIQLRADSGPVEETWPPSTRLLTDWRNSACDCLDILHWSANSRIAGCGGWEHPAVLHLHLARLVLLTPTAHLANLASSPLGRGSKTTEFGSRTSSVKVSHSRVLQWAIRDQFKARLSIIHAGAIFWHVRRYSIDSILEPYAIYTASLVIWAYSLMTQLSRQQISSTTAGTPDRDFRDNANQESPTQGEGESAELDLTFIHIDRPCDDEMVQSFARFGHKMSGHMLRVGDICAAGATRKILREGIRLLGGRPDGASEQEMAVGTGNTSVHGRAQYTWGVERLYAGSLRQLLSNSEYP